MTNNRATKLMPLKGERTMTVFTERPNTVSQDDLDRLFQQSQSWADQYFESNLPNPAHEDLGLDNPWIKWRGKYKGFRFSLFFQAFWSCSREHPVSWGCDIELEQRQITEEMLNGATFKEFCATLVGSGDLPRVHCTSMTHKPADRFGEGDELTSVANLSWDWEHSGWHCHPSLDIHAREAHEVIDALIEARPGILRIAAYDNKFYPADELVPYRQDLTLSKERREEVHPRINDDAE